MYVSMYLCTYVRMSTHTYVFMYVYIPIYNHLDFPYHISHIPLRAIIRLLRGYKWDFPFFSNRN